MPALLIRHDQASRAALLLFVLVAVGCRPDEGIRAYSTPKESPGQRVPLSKQPVSGAAAPDAAAASAEPTHRMLALVVPGGGQAWFFKLVGELSEVDPIADGVTKFYESVRVGDDGKPTWELPDGWSASPPAGMRLATITTGGGLEMSVIGLPLTGDWDAQVLDNVNRWRAQQMGLARVDAAGLAGSTRSLDEPKEAVLVDLKGTFSGGMTAPFAGAAPFAGGAPRAQSPPASPPRITPPQTPPPAKLDYEKPDGWVALPPTATRLANLTTGDGESAATVRASSWPAAGQMGDPAANVNFWRSSLGLPEIGRDEVLRQATPVTVGDEDGVLFRMNEAAGGTSDNSRPPQAITATMVKRGDRVWFFKMAGPAEAVVAEQENYQAWLASIRFTGGE